MPFRTLTLAMTLWAIAHASQAETSGVRGHVTGPDGLALPGVVITMSTTGRNPQAVASGVTDPSGAFRLDVPDGQYALAAELSGFEIAKRMVVVHSDVATLDIRLALASFQESVTITADSTPPSLLAAPQPNAPVTVSRTVINNAMLPNSRYEDVLTLMPGVVRGADDRISVGGTPAETGSLVVNGFNETDPAGGLAGVVVPIDAVDSVEVHTGGYAAEMGRATSGVTSIQTRAGADQFHTSVDSIFPRLLFENGSVHGVEYWEPNVGFSGPIVKDRLFFQQAVSYRFDRNRFTTLAGPERSIYSQPLVWSQLDGVVSSHQRVRFALAFDQQHTDHANITAFTPDTSVPRLAEDGWSAMLSDRLTVARNATLELNGSLLNTNSSAKPSGPGAYLLGHRLATGGYFDDQSRQARRLEGGATITVMPASHHIVKMGTTIDQAALTELDTPNAVSLLRTDNTLSRVVSFQSGPKSHESTDEQTAFIEDVWSPHPSLELEAGVRYDRVGAIHSGTVSPRVAWTMKRDGDRTSISGSAGIFVDKLVLGALAFPSLPMRVVQEFDATAAPSELVQYTNVADALQVPRATRWDLGVDRTFTGGWQAHVRYQERYGRDELILQPYTNPSGASTLVLSSGGQSRQRALETTLGYRPASSGHEFYVSYVRSSARGDLNTFDRVEGLSKDPFVQANEVGPLPTDVPNRLIAWGLLRLPGGITFAPFVTVRSGFPYSAIDDNWVYVGQRDGLRLPTFGSLDISVTRIIELPRQLPRARVGLKLYNLIAANTEREIQRDVAAPDYGMRYDQVPRDFSVVCVFLLGRR